MNQEIKSKLCIVQSAKRYFLLLKTQDNLMENILLIEELDQEVLDSLHKFINDNEVENILFAITPSIANDAFILFIEDKLKIII